MIPKLSILAGMGEQQREREKMGEEKVMVEKIYVGSMRKDGNRTNTVHKKEMWDTKVIVMAFDFF